MTAPVNFCDTKPYPKKVTLEDVTPYVEKNVPYIPEPGEADAAYMLNVPVEGEPEWEEYVEPEEPEDSGSGGSGESLGS